MAAAAAAAAGPRPRTVHVEQCMGTVFTIDIRDVGHWQPAIEVAIAWLHHIDAVFSTYRPDSDISRIRTGRLKVADADPEVLHVLDLCAQVQTTTGGSFSAMPDGKLDPTGLVKGWAVERASRLLREHGSSNHAVNGGGDLQLAGHPAPGRPWRIGIADPSDGTRVRAVVTGSDLAVATSGIAERGQHIIDPFTRRAVAGYTSATVVGPSLTFADAYATATFVMGGSAPRWVDHVDGYETFLIAEDGSVSASAGWWRFDAMR
jgi:thiamine biosynthesis lipoprotein